MGEGPAKRARRGEGEGRRERENREGRGGRKTDSLERERSGKKLSVFPGKAISLCEPLFSTVYAGSEQGGNLA